MEDVRQAVNEALDHFDLRFESTEYGWNSFMAENSEAFLELESKAANIRKLQRFVFDLIKRTKRRK